jgi:hypothetical protein
MNRRALAAALICCALGLSWQWLTVHYNFGGNWTALFCHGSRFPVPAALQWELVYVFPNSGGYDGQSYHYMAHDPLDRNGIGRGVPDPGRRYPRILIPGLAWLLAFGNAHRIDAAFFAVNLGFLFAGAYWLALLLARSDRPSPIPSHDRGSPKERGAVARMGSFFADPRLAPLAAILYVLAPSTVISLDRMLVDLALVSLSLGFAVYCKEGPQWKLYAILCAAPLCRDSGTLLFAAYAIYLLARRRFRHVLLFSTALIPAVAWSLFVRWHLPGGAELGSRVVPFSGIWDAIQHPRVYPFPLPAQLGLRLLERLQLAGALLSIWLGLRDVRRLTEDPLRTLCFLWACFAIILPPGAYDDPFAAARLLAPMMLFQFLRGDRLALYLVAPRVWLQLGPQALGILRGLL